MFIAEWALPDLASYDLTSVRTGIMAGSPCPEEMMKKLIDAGIDEMTIAYGMTETSPVSTQTRTDDSLERKVGTVGRVCPHLEVRIVDPVTGETVPRGEAGEFCTGKLAHYKIPRYVMLVEEFPMTVTGKVRKVEMREVSTRELGLA
jgi:fatty-acyl-CoA synthase